MIFEGPEKKLEVYSFAVNFLTYPHSFWKRLVSNCGAEILGAMSSETCKAYLLSESSLFVWKNKILMITCGRTELIRSAQQLVAHLKFKNIDHFFFERKNEYYPEYQRTFVQEDFQTLKTMFPDGYGLRFGDKDDHHLNLFEYSKSSDIPDSEKTLEVLMYGVKPEVSERFLNPTADNKTYLSDTIAHFFPDYKIDEHWFEPCGYSMNAIKDDNYATIHVTPEKDQNYISFELNNINPDQVPEFMNQIHTTFSPRSCDVIYFDPEPKQEIVLNMAPLTLRQNRFFKLKSGYNVSYYHWSETVAESFQAEEMPLWSFNK